LEKAGAITIGDDIYFRDVEHYNPDSIRGIGDLGHEVEHNKQYHRLGGFKFFVRYNAEYVELRRAGLDDDSAYRAISFEQEAENKRKLIERDLENLRMQLGGDRFWAPYPPRLR
jgi:Domain of unknown function (DUF4157)